MKKDKSLLFPLLVFALLFWACNPTELPDEMVDTPDFYLQGRMDAQPLKLEAGKQGYYMYTRFGRDSLQVYTFESELATCEACPEGMKIVIRDQQVSQAGSSVSLSQSLPVGSYAFRQRPREGENFYRVSFFSEVNESHATAPLSYSWDFGDGSVSTEQNPVHTFSSLDSAYEVCLLATDGQGNSSNICNELNLSLDHCIAQFHHRLRPEYGNYVEFRSEAQGLQPIRYLWEFGDGAVATLNNPGYYYSDDRLYTACLTVIDEHGCISRMCKNVATEPDMLETNFTYSIEALAVPPRDSLGLAQVSIQWTDASGKVFRSDAHAQPDEAHFNLLAVEAYQDNELGQQTARLQVRFSCRLFAGNETLELEDMVGFIGVAYP
ncbi:MAG: PKD domain-containing protein [Bacteroidetes bacterium]|nr:MAG: PKD domain-containing protein [Bacteroidota bacterium]